ncbi:hypothetical protein Pelo_17529 [Pelomyxa schiedti]|nr:hypothetical protein Pelo_17529 [Pelomyxa schiedti]
MVQHSLKTATTTASDHKSGLLLRIFPLTLIDFGEAVECSTDDLQVTVTRGESQVWGNAGTMPPEVSALSRDLMRMHGPSCVFSFAKCDSFSLALTFYDAMLPPTNKFIGQFKQDMFTFSTEFLPPLLPLNWNINNGNTPTATMPAITTTGTARSTTEMSTTIAQVLVGMMSRDRATRLSASDALNTLHSIYDTVTDLEVRSNNKPMSRPPSQNQYQAMRDACGRGIMPEFPSPTWDINTPIYDGDGWTMLHYACALGHEPLLRELLCVGASRNPRIDPNVTTARCRQTPLCLAAWHGHDALVRVLVARSDVDVNKGCPLVGACVGRWMGAVVALLECPRVDVNLAGEATGFPELVGLTALHVACEGRHEEGVKALL